MQNQTNRRSLFGRGLVILLLLQANLLVGILIYWSYTEMQKPPVEIPPTEAEITCERVGTSTLCNWKEK